MTVAIDTTDLANNDPEALAEQARRDFARNPRTAGLNTAYADYLGGFRAALVENDPGKALELFRRVDAWAISAGEGRLRDKVRGDVEQLGLPVALDNAVEAPQFGGPQFVHQFAPATQ